MASGGAAVSLDGAAGGSAEGAGARLQARWKRRGIPRLKMPGAGDHEHAPAETHDGAEDQHPLEQDEPLPGCFTRHAVDPSVWRWPCTRSCPHDDALSRRHTHGGADAPESAARTFGRRIPDGVRAADVERDPLDGFPHFLGIAGAERKTSAGFRQLTETLRIRIGFNGVHQADRVNDDVGRPHLAEDFFEGRLAGVIAPVADDHQHLCFDCPALRYSMPSAMAS